jgi:hypothetical protein
LKKKSSSKLSSKLLGDIPESEYLNLQLIDFNTSIYNHLPIVEEGNSDSELSKTNSYSSLIREEKISTTAPQINISYNIYIQNNLNFSKNSTILSDSRKLDITDNNDTFITNNFMSKDFQDTIIDNIGPSQVLQNLKELKIEAV